ncbi:MAG: sulfotransferase [Synechococcales bacterium]|nr:sulfotransferase [Synechococcales bacterium]
MHRTKYIVIGMGRSGTTLVHTCLKGHPNVVATNDEVKVKPLFDQGLATYTMSGHAHLTEAEKQQGIPALFDAITAIDATENTLATGCKVALWSPDEASLLIHAIQKYLTNLKIIYVERENWIAQYGSVLRAKITRQYHKWVDKKSQNHVKVNIPLKDFLEYACTCHKIKSEIAKLNKTHQVYHLSYERDILANNSRAYAKVFEFLGLPPVEITWVNSKKVAPPPGEYILNYAYLSEQFERLKSHNFNISQIRFSYQEKLSLWWQWLTPKMRKISSRINFLEGRQ